MTWPASPAPPGRAFEAVGDGGPRDMVTVGPFGGRSQNPAYGRLGVPLCPPLGALRPERGGSPVCRTCFLRPLCVRWGCGEERGSAGRATAGRRVERRHPGARVAWHRERRHALGHPALHIHGRAHIGSGLQIGERPGRCGALSNPAPEFENMCRRERHALTVLQARYRFATDSRWNRSRPRSETDPSPSPVTDSPGNNRTTAP